MEKDASRSGSIDLSALLENLTGLARSGIRVALHVTPPPTGEPTLELAGLRLVHEHARLRLLRGFDELL